MARGDLGARALFLAAGPVIVVADNFDFHPRRQRCNRADSEVLFAEAAAKSGEQLSIKAVRRQAETAYNQFVASSAEQASSLLLQLLQQAPDPQMRMLAAVLLRRRVNAPNKGACVLVRLDLSHVPAPLCVCFSLFVYPLDPPLPPYLCCFDSSLFLSPSLPL